MTHIVLILGSLRSDSNSAKALAVIADELARLGGCTTSVIDPRAFPLPWPGVPGGEAAVLALEGTLRAAIRAADAVVVVTPEYDGSISAVLKLLIEYFGYPSALAGKPVALVGVAQGRLGALRALEHLRAIMAHIGAVVIPRTRSVAAVHRSFGPGGACVDPVLRSELAAVAAEVVGYARRLKAP